MQIEGNKDNSNNFVGMHGQNVGLGFAARDNAAKSQQQKNQIVFKVIRNQNNNHLKNIFARQLPKMPKQYIVKLVFDRNHESMIILKNNQKVIGGICFRQFTEERFAQIAFLAITSTEQIRGFGTRLMNKLKEQMQRRKVQYLMTYADNLALGYFRKQGFSKDCRMPQQRWKGYIKDYQGGTMMECFVHPTIDYSRVTQIIKKQKDLVVAKIKQLSLNSTIFNGQELQKKMKDQGYIRKNPEGQQEVFRINPLQIPGVKQSGWSWNDHDQLVKTKQASFLLQCQNVIQLLKKHPSVWPFRDPVSLDDVPDYIVIVKNPIDLKTIQKKLGNNQYKDRQNFCQDIKRIFENCRLYNQPQTVYFKCSMQLEQYIKPHLQSLKQGRIQLNMTNDYKRPVKKSKKKTIDKKVKKN